MKKILIIPIAFLLFSCSSSTEPTENNPTISNNTHIEFGIPTDNNSADDFIIERYQYVLSYNSEKGVPNWVSWNTEAHWFGDAPRFKGSFKKDPLIGNDMKVVSHSDYTNSGYDRGHLVRSEERTDCDSNNIATFYLTNVMPQTPDLNRGAWLKLEYYYEKLVKEQNKELYIIAGGIYHTNNYIKDKVAIPDSCFKIIVVMDKDKGLPNITTNTQIIAVVMPNIQGIRKEHWEQWQTSVDRIENSTGYDFLDKIPDDIEYVLEK